MYRLDFSFGHVQGVNFCLFIDTNICVKFITKFSQIKGDERYDRLNF